MGRMKECLEEFWIKSLLLFMFQRAKAKSPSEMSDLETCFEWRNDTFNRRALTWFANNEITNLTKRCFQLGGDHNAEAIFITLKMGHSRSIFLHFRLFNSLQYTGYVSQLLLMTEFEPRTSGIVSDRSANWATATAQY